MPRNQAAVNIVEGALALGFSLSEAVQRALGRSLSRFAAEHGHRASEVSMCLNGYKGRVYPRIRDDLASALGVDRETIDRWIDARRRVADSAA